MFDSVQCIEMDGLTFRRVVFVRLCDCSVTTMLPSCDGFSLAGLLISVYRAELLVHWEVFLWGMVFSGALITSFQPQFSQ